MRRSAVFEDISLSNVSSIPVFSKISVPNNSIYKVARIDAPCPCAGAWIRHGDHRIAPKDETYSGRSRLSRLPR